MAASCMLCLYGWLRNDFAIIIGQFVAYYIYIWNLQVKKSWEKLPKMAQVIFLAIPIAAIVYFLFNWDETFTRLFKQENLPLWLIIYGIVGQFAFTLRFIYQWLYSRKAGESVLPTTFWVISLIGALMIVSYGVIRHDPILILAQTTGVIVYARNIMIACKSTNNSNEITAP